MRKRLRIFLILILFVIAEFELAYAQTVRFTKDLSIKSNENDEKASFLMVERVDADSRGNVYALAGREYKIQVYSPRGEFLRTIGKKGQGPGEFEMPLYIILDREDNLYVFDFMKAAFVVFDPKGNYLKNISTKGLYREIPDKIGFDSGGDFVIGSDRIEEDVFKISRFDRDFNRGEDLYVKDGVVSWLIKGGGVRIQAPRYTPGVVWTMDDQENLYVCYNKSYNIEIYSLEKKLIRKITRKFTPEEVPKEEVEESLKQSKGMLTAADVPKYKPPVRRMFVVEGYLLVQTKRKEDKAIFDVFDRNGTYLEEIVLDFLPWICKKGYVYTSKPSPDLSECEVLRFKVEVK